MNKYHAKRTIIGSESFDSKLEARFYSEYLLPFSKERDQDFKIERQKKYDIIVNGKKICEYIADFVCTAQGYPKLVYECKGMMLPDALMKLRLFEALYGIPIYVVRSLSSIEKLKGYRKRK